MKNLIALSAITLALAAAGCGGDDKKTDSTTTSRGYSSGTATQAGNVAVEIKGFAFTPSDLTVKKGTKITWTNEDSAAHNVKGGDLKSETLNQGDSYSYTADETGTIEYVCTFHSNMKAKLTVTD